MAEITLDQLTNATNKSGAFEILAGSVLKQLQDEFSAGRITATEFSKVFATTLDNVLSQAIQFLLQKDVTTAQIALLDAQRAMAVTQELQVQKEILLTEKKIEQLDREIELMDDQQDLLKAQVLLTGAQKDKTVVEADLLVLEKSKTTAETALVNQQVIASTKQVEILSAQLLNIPKEGVLLDKQTLKTVEETTFLSQRIKTEKAQILDTVDGAAVTGILGKQRNLYQAQTDGFTRDAEYKLASLMANTWTVRRSTDEGTVADTTNKLSDANIGAVLTKAMTSLSITPA